MSDEIDPTVADEIRKRCAAIGMTPRQFANVLDSMTFEQVATAMERMPAAVREFGAGFEALGLTERDSIRAKLATAKHDAERWRNAHDGILSEAARTIEESAGELALLERRATRAEEYCRNADQDYAKIRAELTASQERERVLREALAKTPCKCVTVVLADCPVCEAALESVTNRGDVLNDEQFASVRAGDYYCAACKGEEAATGHKYWWTRDLPSRLDMCNRCTALATPEGTPNV